MEAEPVPPGPVTVCAGGVTMSARVAGAVHKTARAARAQQQGRTIGNPPSRSRGSGSRPFRGGAALGWRQGAESRAPAVGSQNEKALATLKQPGPVRTLAS